MRALYKTVRGAMAYYNNCAARVQASNAEDSNDSREKNRGGVRERKRKHVYYKK